MMKKSVIKGIVALTVLLPLFASCNNPQENIHKSSSALQQKVAKTIDVEGTVNEVYALNEEIDYSYFVIIIGFDDNTTQRFNVDDENVVVTGGDTSTEGQHQLVFSCFNLEKVFYYEVKAFRLTLDFNGGTYDGKEKVEIIPDNYQVNIAEYVPTYIDNNEEYEFAGWFYDKELTQRVNSDIDGFISIRGDVTIYAGYDHNYNDLFSYVVGTDNTISLTSLLDGAFSVGPELVIPRTIKLYPIVGIADGFFDEDFAMFYPFNTLSFAENSEVKYIGKKAFKNSYIEYINLPDKLETIDEEAFSNSHLTGTLTLPKSLKKINDYAFFGNYQLGQIDFQEKGSLAYIGVSAFAYCTNLASLVFPDSLIQIRSEAFHFCESVESVYISSSIENIGLRAFSAMSNLKEFIVDENNKNYCSIDGNLYSKDKKTFIRYCFNKSATEFTVPDTVERIYENAFDVSGEISDLAKINLPEGLISIGGEAFRECNAEFVLPSTLRSIEFSAFFGYGGKTFQINPNNRLFRVIDGILCSYDGKELCSVPTNYYKDTLVIPSSIETIRSYALSGSNTIEFIIINSDSNLKKVNECGLALFHMKKLLTVSIYKPEPFELVDNACVLNQFAVNQNFKICISDSYINEYMNKWVNYTNTIENCGDYLIQNNLYNFSDFASYCIDTISNNGFGFTSYEQYLRGIPCFKRMETKAALNYIGDSMNVLNSLYYLNTLDTKYIEYIKSFERSCYQYIIDLVKNIDDTMLANIDFDFNIVIDRLSIIPSEIYKVIEPFYDNIMNISDRLDSIQKQQDEFIQKVMLASEDLSSFTAESFILLQDEFNKLGSTHIRLTSKQNKAWYKLECSYDIYEFLSTPLNYENLSKLNIIVYGDEDHTKLGIDNYLRFYFTDEESQNSLYRYQDYLNKKQEFDEFVNQNVLTMDEYGQNLDINMTYDDIVFNDIQNRYDSLGDNLYFISDLASIKYELLLLRKDMQLFNLKFDEVTINFDNLEESYDMVLAIDNKINLLTSFANVEDISILDSISSFPEYQKYIQVSDKVKEFINQSFNEFNSLIAAITADNVLDNSASFNSLYNYLDKYINIYEYDEWGYVAGYNETYYMLIAIIISAKMQNILKNYEVLTVDNYLQVDHLLYSYYDDANHEEVEGLVNLIEEIKSDFYFNEDLFNQYLNVYCQSENRNYLDEFNNYLEYFSKVSFTE